MYRALDREPGCPRTGMHKAVVYEGFARALHASQPYLIYLVTFRHRFIGRIGRR
jgi:hypothetical protein